MQFWYNLRRSCCPISLISPRHPHAHAAIVTVSLWLLPALPVGFVWRGFLIEVVDGIRVVMKKQRNIEICRYERAARWQHIY